MLLPSFYPILDSESLAKKRLSAIAATHAVLDGGARILQFRHKSFWTQSLFDEVQQIAALCRAYGALFVVNDRADLARLTGAALHVGQEDLSPSSARLVLGKDAIVGLSTHNESQLRLAALEPTDYLAFGPIFETSSKQNPDPVVGLDELKRIRHLTTRPMVAIGGITRRNARGVLEAGADSVAVIGDLYPDDGDFNKRTREWLKIL